MDRVGGMDGAKAGWVLVTAPANGSGPSTVSVVPDLAVVFSRIDSGELAAVAIDIPIGLPDLGPRTCDLQARKMISPRSSSVFPAPLRCVLGSASWEEACDRYRAVSGKNMSKQAFGILPKIEAVDNVMTPERQRSVVEVHPEVSFTALAGHPMVHHKRTPEGRLERLRVLRPEFSDLDHAARPLRMTQPDDVLDAYVAAWSARRWFTGTYTQLGGDLDSRGLRMEMIA